MTGKTHIASGILGALAYSYFKEDPNLILLVSGGILGSLVPDIDSQQSTMSKILPFISKPWAFIRKKAKQLKFKTAGDILEHRGFTHSLFFVVLLGGIFYFLNLLSAPFILGLLVGILSHIAIDMLNDVGVPLFLPIFFKRLKIATITTGKFAEKIFFIVVWVLNALVIYLLISNNIPSFL